MTTLSRTPILGPSRATLEYRAWRRMRGACRGTRRRGAHNPRLLRARKAAATRAGRKWRAGR